MPHLTDPYRPYDDGQFFIELNRNYRPENANAFLCKRAIPGTGFVSSHHCIGGAEPDVLTGKWRADIHTPYDEETDSDARSVGGFDTQAEALEVLWHNRMRAYSRV